jgi:hypothetical protein
MRWKPYSIDVIRRPAELFTFGFTYQLKIFEAEKPRIKHPTKGCMLMQVLHNTAAVL